jgi:riboflavin biosynthesis pyrimidine reductase
MNRPQLIVHSVASLDGRLTLAPDVLLLYGDPRWQMVSSSDEDVYARLMQEYQPQALLEGSGSLMLPGQSGDPLPPVEGDTGGLYQHFLPETIVKGAANRRWFSVVDSQGRVRWLYKEFPGETWSGYYLLVLVAHKTPATYLAYLQRENIPYLVVGDQRVDLPLALSEMQAQLGVQTVVSTAGGRLNGALLRAGLVDETSVEFCPAVIGGEHTPSLFTAPDLLPAENPVRLKLKDCQARPDGKVWLRYWVLREGA